MNLREYDPEFAAFIDTLRSSGMVGEARIQAPALGYSKKWAEPEQDIDALLEAKGMGKVWCAQQRALLRAKKVSR